MAHLEDLVATTCETSLYWEGIAQRRLGCYITEQERQVLEHGMALAGRPGAAVEIGCEGGRWSRLLAAQGWHLVCTDVDPVALEMCHRRLPAAKCVLVDKNQTRLPIRTNSVAFLLCYEVEPVSQADWFASEAARILAPGGMLAITFLNGLSVRAVIHRMLRHSSGAGAFYRRSYHSNRRSLQEAGFELLEELGCCWIPFPRDSNSPLIPVCAKLESALGLRSAPSLSPWVIALARKKGANS